MSDTLREQHNREQGWGKTRRQLIPEVIQTLTLQDPGWLSGLRRERVELWEQSHPGPPPPPLWPRNQDEILPGLEGQLFLWDGSEEAGKGDRQHSELPHREERTRSFTPWQRFTQTKKSRERNLGLSLPISDPDRTEKGATEISKGSRKGR